MEGSARKVWKHTNFFSMSQINRSERKQLHDVKELGGQMNTLYWTPLLNISVIREPVRSEYRSQMVDWRIQAQKGGVKPLQLAGTGTQDVQLNPSKQNRNKSNKSKMNKLLNKTRLKNIKCREADSNLNSLICIHILSIVNTSSRA